MVTFEEFKDHLAGNLKMCADPLATASKDQTFDALGFDSLHLVEATMATEQLFDVYLSEHEMDSCVTLGDLYDLAVKQASPQAA